MRRVRLDPYQHATYRPRNKARTRRPEDHQALRRRRAPVVADTRWRKAMAARLPLRRRSKDVRDWRLPRSWVEGRKGSSRSRQEDFGPRSGPFSGQRAAKVAQGELGANSFAAVAEELLEKKRRDSKAAATLRKFEWFMSFAFPALGSRPIR